MEEQTISLLIVDDHPFMRAGIAAILCSAGGIEVRGEASTGREALERLALLKPDIALIDLQLPDISGDEVIRRGRPLSPKTRFIVLTTYEGDEDIHRALSSEAHGYVIKGMPHDVLLTAIKQVHKGKVFLPPTVRRSMQMRGSEPLLSGREKQVLHLVIDGLTNREIGNRLSITEATVKGHMTLIFEKLNVKDRVQAVISALQRGIAHL